MRVAYILRAFPRLSETFILHELLALRALGLDVRLFAFEQVCSMPVHPAASRLLPEVRFLRAVEPASRSRAVPRREAAWHAAGERLAPLLIRERIAHVHAHFAGPAATAARAAGAAAGVPYSFTAHAKDIFVEGLDWDWLARLGADAASVVTVCEYNRRYLRRRMPDAHIVRIHNGVDLARWRPRTHASTDGPVLAVGRLVRKKGFHVLLDALAHLRDRGRPMRAVLVGEGREGDALRAQARALRLGRLVRFAGALTAPQVERQMARASMVALPCVVDEDGNQDALPTVLLEAAAAGVPAVASRVAGVPEIVRDGETGWLVEPGDVRGLARALDALRRHGAQRARMGMAARAHAERRFDQTRVIRALAAVFAGERTLKRSQGGTIDAHRSAVL